MLEDDDDAGGVFDKLIVVLVVAMFRLLSYLRCRKTHRGNSRMGMNLMN